VETAFRERRPAAVVLAPISAGFRGAKASDSAGAFGEREAMTLEEMWNELKKRIAPDSQIQTWTADQGYGEDKFMVVAVKGGFVHVVSAGDEKVQKIPDQDFAKVLGVWNDYVDGKLPAANLREQTKFTKHVVSILHSLESQH
jgi:hypothetical protein